jgi:cytochrome c peroxidase
MLSTRNAVLLALLGLTGSTSCGSSPFRSVKGLETSPQALSCERRHPGIGAARTGTVRQSGVVALASAHPGGATLAYIADADEPTLHTVDVDAHREIAATRLRDRPEQVMVLADGRVAVTLRRANAIEILEPPALPTAPLSSLCVTDVAAEPIALAGTPDDRTLLVTSAWTPTLTALDATNLHEQYHVELPREPRAVVVSDDGARAFVAHVVGAKMSVTDLKAAAQKPREIDLRAKLINTSVGRSKGDSDLRGGCQGFTLAKAIDPEQPEDPRKAIPLGDLPKAPKPKHPVVQGRIFAPMVSVESGDVRRTSSGYGDSSGPIATETGEVPVIDEGAERLLTRSILAVPTVTPRAPECLLPRAAAYNAGSLYVTCLGIDSLVELDASTLDPARAETRRWAVGGGPMGVAIDAKGKRAVVFSQFDREVEIISLAPTVPAAGDAASTDRSAMNDVTRVSLSQAAGEALAAPLALGRRLFHKSSDPRVSQDGRACASCHPDGREDALTWSTPDGPRQTPMLAGRLADTAPYGWLGGRATLTEHVKQTFERLQGSGLPDDEREALLAYVTAMPVPRPRAVPKDAETTKLVAQGKTLFYSADAACSSCHDPDHGFADGYKHDVEAPTIALERTPSKQAKVEPGFDTPSLRFISGTAPYFHDGRYATLRDMLASTDHAMGQTMHLSHGQREALVAYLESL